MGPTWSITIEFAPSASRQFQDLPRKVQERIRPRIDALADVPRPPGVEKVQGTESSYRIRVGNYRVIYAIQDDRLIVLVLRVGHRRDIDRNL